MKTYKRRKKLPLCACGCGKRVTKAENKYIRGHNAKKGSEPKSKPHRFKKGNTIGKAGRPQGSRNRVTIAAENIFEAESGTIARQAVEMALNGHPQMIKLILERVVPIKKSSAIQLQGMPKIDSLESASLASKFLLESTLNGKLDPVNAEILSRLISKQVNCLQLSDLESEIQMIKEKLVE